MGREPDHTKPPTVVLLVFIGMWALMAVMGALWSAFGSNADGGVVYTAGGLAWVMAGLAYLALRKSSLTGSARWLLTVLAFGVGAGLGYLIAHALIGSLT